MNVGELVQSRRDNWRELDELCSLLANRRRRTVAAATMTRFASLYRAACADLALAEAYQLPPAMTTYLHRLVGRAHNQLYRSRIVNFAAWREELLYNIPRRLRKDRCLWLAFSMFWSVFLFSMFLAANWTLPMMTRPLVPGFDQKILGEETVQELEDSFRHPLHNRDGQEGTMAACGYFYHNTSIGLSCFALGLVFGIGGLFATVYNAAFLGAAFGHMFHGGAARPNFFEFVTAHGPFELTAIVVSAAAGMRLGFSLINTNGRTRIESLQATMYDSLPTMVAAAILFGLAGMIEAFVSPSRLPYFFKAAIAIISTILLLSYYFLLGWQRSPASSAADAVAEPQPA